MEPNSGGIQDQKAYVVLGWCTAYLVYMQILVIGLCSSLVLFPPCNLIIETNSTISGLYRHFEIQPVFINCICSGANHNLFQLRYRYCTQVLSEQLAFVLTNIRFHRAKEISEEYSI